MAINVKTYGAKGDGSTNDTTAFEAAINVAVNGDSSEDPPIPPNTALYVPSGIYILEPLDVALDSGESFSILGDSAGSSILKKGDIQGSDPDAPILNVFGTGSTESSVPQNVSVRDLGFDGNDDEIDPPQGDPYALLRVWNVRFSTIESIRIFSSPSRGLEFGGDETMQGNALTTTNALSQIIITTCADVACLLIDAKFTTITSLIINNVEDDGLVLRSSSSSDSSGHSVLSNLIFNEVNSGACITIHDAQRAAVSGVNILDATIGVYLLGRTSHTSLSNVIMRQCNDGIIVDAEEESGAFKFATGLQFVNIDILGGSAESPRNGITLRGVSDSVFSNIVLRQLDIDTTQEFSKGVWLRSTSSMTIMNKPCLDNLFTNVNAEACSQSYRIDDSSSKNRFVNCKAQNSGTPMQPDLWCAAGTAHNIISLKGDRSGGGDLEVDLGHVHNFWYFDSQFEDIPSQVAADNLLFVVWDEPQAVSGDLLVSGRLHRTRHDWDSDADNAEAIHESIPVRIRLAASGKVAENPDDVVISNVNTGTLLEPLTLSATKTAVIRANSNGQIAFTVSGTSAKTADVVIASTFLSEALVFDREGPLPLTIP